MITIKNRFIKKKYLVFFSIFFVVIIIAIWINKTGHSPKNKIVSSAIKLPNKFFSGTKAWFKNKTSFIVEISDLKKNNERLYAENLKFKSQLASLNDVKKENEQLRKKLDLPIHEKYELENATIIGRDVGFESTVVLIDKGRKHGIEVDMPVVIGDGILIGKIVDSFHSSAKVSLIFEKNTKYNAEIIESGARGVVVGKFGTSINMEMISQAEEINKGDSIITSDISNKIPRGLLIGYVQDVVVSSDQLFQVANISQPFEYKKLRIISVIKKAKQ